jgi:hypothetical protein
MRRVQVVLMVTAGLSAAAASAAEKEALLLNGFEPEVIAQWAAKTGKRARKGEDGQPSWPGIRGRLSPGDCTEGKHALVKRIDKHLQYLRDGGRESSRRTVGGVFKTWSVFRGCYPEDWSGYVRLRLDVKSQDAPLQLRVDLEDSVIAPPLRRLYRVPAGKWVTLEYDLAEASRLRRVPVPGEEDDSRGAAELSGRLINLEQMAGICVTVERLEKPTTVKLDNLRLVAAGTREGETELPVLTDPRPFVLPEPLPPSSPEPREPLTGKLNRAPLEWEEPVEIPLASGSYGLQLFDVAPVDNDRMLMAVGTIGVLKTLDGGKTWTGLDGVANKPTRVIDHDTNAPGRIAAAMGPDLMVLGTAKCSGRATPVDSYSVLVRFDGTDWKPQPRGLVDVDDRHCPEHRVRAVRLPGGRIWACWMHEDRWYKYQMHARYSDDEGRSWRDAASNGLLQLTTRGRSNPYCTTWWLERPAMPEWAAGAALGNVGSLTHSNRHSHMQIVPWGRNVLCAYVTGGKMVFATFDGTRWSQPRAAGVEGEPSAAAHLEDRTVYLATSAGKVYRLEDGKWTEDSPPGGVGQGRLSYPGCDRTRLSVAGSVLVALWTDGRKLFVSQKPKGGAWSKAREIFDEERGVHHIGAPVRSVENFVPFVWSIRGKTAGARFVRVPVKGP